MAKRMTVHRWIVSTLLFSFSTLGLRAQPAIDPFHPDSLRATVSCLAHDSLQGRLAGTSGCLAATRYIVNRFNIAGLDPLYNNRFHWPFKGSDGLRTHNVFAVLPGRTKPDEWVLFSAHYDHIGTERTAEWLGAGLDYDLADKIFNGANDNASGVAGLIALAEKAVLDTPSERTLVFAAFSAEELGLLGSYAAADTMDVKKIVAHVNLEMLGRPVKNYSGRPYLSGSELSDLLSILNTSLEARDSVRGFFRKDPYKDADIFYRSDNYPFHQKGVVAHTISVSSPEDRYYHSVDDEIETLDYAAMSALIGRIYRGCRSLMDGTATPAKPARRRASRRP